MADLACGMSPADEHQPRHPEQPQDYGREGGRHDGHATDLRPPPGETPIVTPPSLCSLRDEPFLDHPVGVDGAIGVPQGDGLTLPRRPALSVISCVTAAMPSRSSS